MSLLGVYHALKNRAVQVGLLFALAAVALLYVYRSMRKDIISRVEADHLKRSMRDIRNAIKARNDTRRRNASGGLRDDDGWRRD